MAAIFFLLCARGRGGRQRVGGYRGVAPIKKNCGKKKYSVQGVGGVAVGGGGYRGGLRVQFFFYSYPEGPPQCFILT